MNQTASPFSSSSDSAFALRFTFPGLLAVYLPLVQLDFFLLFVLYHTPGSRVRVRLLRDFTTRPSSVAIEVVVTTDLTVCIFFLSRYQSSCGSSSEPSRKKNFVGRNKKPTKSK